MTQQDEPEDLEAAPQFEGVRLTDRSHAQMESFRSAHDTKVLTILLSDLVGSTRQQSELGNVRSAELVQRHRAVFRDVLAGFEGQEVETAGDSFLVVFAAPSEGVKFALHMQAAMRQAGEGGPELPLARIGLHQGQVVVQRHAEGPKALDIYGLQVSTTARIADLAAGGQTLCSRAVFDDARAILRGDELRGLGPVAWQNHGPFRFKGVDEPYDVCEVGEEGAAPLAAPPATTKSWPADQPEEELGWRPAAGATVPETNWLLQERLGRKEPTPSGALRFRGEFGEVWKAWNPGDKSHQAFKFCFKRDRVPALKREARLLKRLRKYRHPSLVEVYDVTEGDQPPYYLEMEYVAGPSLDEWLATDPPLGERLEAIAQVADALDVVHAAGIYHRDIKPSNILLTRREDGSLLAKLSDFGLGAAEDEELLKSIYNSRVEGIAGTWDYIAPEIRRGGRASAQSDLYSLGVTLYQVAVGDLLRTLGDWEGQVESEVLREDIRRCIATDPAQRWRSAAQLAQALRSHDERLERRRLEREREAQRRRLKRLGLIAGLVGLFALVVVGFGGFATLQWIEARRQREEAEHLGRIAQTERDGATRQRDEAHRQRARAEAQRARAVTQQREAEKQAMRALANAGRGLLERAQRHEERGEQTRAFLLAAQAIGFRPYGGFSAGYPLLFPEGSVPYQQAVGITMAHPFPLVWRSPVNRHHNFPITAVAYQPDGKVLATADIDGLVRFWDLRTGQPLRCAAFRPAYAACLCYSPDGRLLAAGGPDGSIRVLDALTGRRRPVLEGHTGPVSGLAFRPDGRILASAGADRSVRLWDVASARQAAALSGHSDIVTGVSFRPDGKILAASSTDKTVRLWEDLAASQPAMTVLGRHGAAVTCVSFSPDGRTLAAGTQDRKTLLWDVAERKAEAPLEGHAGGVSALAFSPDGRILASASTDRTVQLWDVAARKAVRRLRGHTLADNSVRFAPDGKTLATAGRDGTARLWDVATGTPKTACGGHSGRVHGVCFSPNGTILASASSDGAVRLWEAASGRVVATCLAHPYSVACVAFAPDGTMLASGDLVGNIGLWEAASGTGPRRQDPGVGRKRQGDPPVERRGTQGHP